MQKLINLFIAILFSTMFFTLSQAQTKTSNEKIFIYYFHATNRCPSCLAVENAAKEMLNENFKSKIDNGTIKFESFNIDDKANKALVEKYQIGFSTLLIIKADGTKTDFTNTAFQYAKSNPTKYKELLKAKIIEMMQ